MNEKDKEKYKYRFSGYQLPLEQLDAAGPIYIRMPVNYKILCQPDYYDKPYFRSGAGDKFTFGITPANTRRRSTYSDVYPMLEL